MILKHYIRPFLENENFTSSIQLLNPDQIAAYGIINKNRCTDLFRKYTRLSPIKYLNEYRLYMAKNLILNTKKPISEISTDVGYNQISHFIEQFRGAYGLSPLKYRNQFAGQSSDRTSSLS